MGFIWDSEDFQTRFGAFNERFKVWLRIEPRCRRDDFGQGIQARTADPLWFLTRQWQTGEFAAQDSGSPIRAKLRCSAQPPLCRIFSTGL